MFELDAKHLLSFHHLVSSVLIKEVCLKVEIPVVLIFRGLHFQIVRGAVVEKDRIVEM